MKLDKNENSEANLQIKCPDEKKPKFTIQDSYLSYYFGFNPAIVQSKEEGFEYSSINLPKDKLEKQKGKNYRSEILKFIKQGGNDNLVEDDGLYNQSVTVSSNDKADKKYLGKKKRKEIDPLDVTTVRSYKGDFVNLERKSIKNAPNNISKNIASQQSTISTKYENYSLNDISFATQTNSQLLTGEATTNSALKNKKEEVELIPKSIRDKMKK